MKQKTKKKQKQTDTIRAISQTLYCIKKSGDMKK